jgi:hypothetical protein
MPIQDLRDHQKRRIGAKIDLIVIASVLLDGI